MTYEEALSYIGRIGSLGSRPGLSRIRELCRLLGDPQDSLRFVHVGGTNGKGSFCAILTSVLTAAGYRVGRYTSPYVRRFNERIALGDRPIGDKTLARLTGRVKRAAESMADPPTEFELITALGFCYFKEKKCDLVVLEVGLGGRLDATNIIKTPLLSVVTGISLDHTAILGDTEEKIAREKAGIFREGVPVLCGCERGTPAAAVIAREAAKKRCPLVYAREKGLTVRRAVLGETVFDYGDRRDLSIRLASLYQPKNAAAVLDALPLLAERGFPVGEEALRRGLRSARWPARFERLAARPPVIFDGSHNPEGIGVLCESVRHYFPGVRPVLCTGVMRDKDYGAMARLLAPLAREVFTFPPQNPRALDPALLAAEYEKNGVPARAFPSGTEALSAALAAAKEKKLPLLICGSLYSYAELRPLFDRGRGEGKR